MKKLNTQKVLNEGDFYVQEQSGWPGMWIIFLRYNHDKFTMKCYQEKKPVLTRRRKMEVAKAYVADREAEKHNLPLFNERRKLVEQCSHILDTFDNIMGRDEQVFNIVKNALLDNCEYPKVNEALQRLLDYEERAERWREVEAKIIKAPSRVLFGSPEDVGLPQWGK